MKTLRKNLPPLPDRMKSLPIDERGYPIPWFVQWIDGKPDFRLIDADKFHTASIANLCSVCGQTLGRYKSFVGGPMNVLQLISGEPPMHRDCALFSVRACPFLLLPLAQRSAKAFPDDVQPVGEQDDVFFEGNPGITSVWTCTRHTRSVSGRTFKFLDCTSLEWFTQGREATQEEITSALHGARDRLATILREEHTS